MVSEMNGSVLVRILTKIFFSPLARAVLWTPESSGSYSSPSPDVSLLSTSASAWKTLHGLKPMEAVATFGSAAILGALCLGCPRLSFANPSASLCSISSISASFFKRSHCVQSQLQHSQSRSSISLIDFNRIPSSSIQAFRFSFNNCQWQ